MQAALLPPPPTRGTAAWLSNAASNVFVGEYEVGGCDANDVNVCTHMSASSPRRRSISLFLTAADAPSLKKPSQSKKKAWGGGEKSLFFFSMKMWNFAECFVLSLFSVSAVKKLYVSPWTEKRFCIYSACRWMQSC